MGFVYSSKYFYFGVDLMKYVQERGPKLHIYYYRFISLYQDQIFLYYSIKHLMEPPAPLWLPTSFPINLPVLYGHIHQQPDHRSTSALLSLPSA